MLELTDLQVSIDHKNLLNIESFTVLESEVFTILGKNGAGKSTLFKAISGEIKSTGFRVLHQQDIKNWSRKNLARHLAVLPQSSQLNFPFSVREVVALGLIPLSINYTGGQKLVSDKLELTDTARFANRPYLSLSGGERQRVHLARVLVQLSQAENPPLLLLDEPTSAQDLAQQHQLLNVVSHLSRNHQYSVLMILHDINLASRYSDRVGIIEDGRMSTVGSPTATLSSDLIEEKWGYRPQKLTINSGEVAFL